MNKNSFFLYQMYNTCFTFQTKTEHVFIDLYILMNLQSDINILCYTDPQLAHFVPYISSSESQNDGIHLQDTNKTGWQRRIFLDEKTQFFNC